jgi:hypothetical protein
MSKRLVVRCAVYDSDKLVEVIEQSMPPRELAVALRRAHFNSRFVAAMESEYKVIFTSKKEG